MFEHNPHDSAQDGLDDELFDVAEFHSNLAVQSEEMASIIIRPDFTILDQIGNVGQFITWQNNENTINLLQALPEGIKSNLEDAVEITLQEDRSLQSKVIHPDDNGILQAFRLNIHPFILPDEETFAIQVQFQAEKSVTEANNTMQSDQPIEEVMGRLQSELQQAKEQVAMLTQQLEEKQSPTGANGTPRAALSDEKLRKQNDELRSTNKELLELNRDLVHRVEKMRKKAQQAPVPPKETPEVRTGAPQASLTPLAANRHELRTALTSIIGFADLLASRLDTEDDKELANYIAQAGHRLSETLDSLLEPETEAPEVVAVQAEPEEQHAEETNRLLVVEDSDATRRLLSLVLSDKFECELAADATEAIEKAEKELFKAVLLDINLGKGKSGVDVLHYLRQNAQYQRVPFMAVTAMASPQDEYNLLDSGFDAYVSKPFQKAKLLTTLDQMLSQEGVA